MAETPKDLNASPTSAGAGQATPTTPPTKAAQEPDTNADGTPKAVTVAEPAAGSPDARKMQEEQRKAEQEATQAAQEETDQVTRMQIVQQAPYTGTVMGATDTTRGGKYMVGGKMVDANGVPITEREEK